MRNAYAQPQPASASTIQSHGRFRSELDFSDTTAFSDAARGYIATIPDARIIGADGKVVWDLGRYHFLEQSDAPDTVNPSLWRQARLNMHHGLFKVVDGIYQVRGFDLANITFIEGEKGIVVIDPLTYEESARAALDLYWLHRGHRPVVAVIYSHSHRDHFGGVLGVTSVEDVAAGRVSVIAPTGFMDEVVSEMVMAGVPMRRRAAFQFGPSLMPGPMSQVDSGLGKNAGQGTYSMIPPTMLITETVEEHVIDGVKIVFQLTPGTEAPAEMNFYFPGHRALNLAENACHTMHNLCPLRGAKTRDSLAWSRYLDEALDLYGDKSDVVFAQHHWPTWGSERVVEFIRVQRDLYRFLHDQTLRLMSHGLTPREIAEQLMLPNALSRNWSARGYYGAIAHNVEAIYAHYLGPYDGNPAHLHRLPPVELGKKVVEYMGGNDAILERARADMDAGQFRWVAEVMNHVVFADPGCWAARELGANAMEQMGYQAESATWRNAYLLGALELRNGVDAAPPTGNTVSVAMMTMLPISRFLDSIAIRLDGLAIQALQGSIDWLTPDEGSCHRLVVSNGAMSHLPGSHGERADARIHVPRKQLWSLLQGEKGLYRAATEGRMKITGNVDLVIELFRHMDDFNPMFHILEP
ncbi:alkyl/aryl-sulfatase [Achromobacter sp. UMC46]|uniref:alkyl/aryl-sulfatase n=2 Tax=Burkholderiales TaxID=80840 RepID=UPI001603D325|nr:alkyl sulfatase dimerization domain-containing protein [Achromobacter sp. UMC46]MBB1594625.1 hypothetical protein [Achromobacter sp. UMC46]